jgi:hypothetical protein
VTRPHHPAWCYRITFPRATDVWRITPRGVFLEGGTHAGKGTGPVITLPAPRRKNLAQWITLLGEPEGEELKSAERLWKTFCWLYGGGR